jgi:hypothetical protein
MSTLFADPVPKTEADTTESDKTEGGAAAVKKTEGEKTEITTDAPHGRCNHRKDWKRLRAKKGCAFFMCCLCGSKWNTNNTGEDSQGV